MILAVCEGRVLSVPALCAYLAASLEREKRIMYLGDLLWLCAVKGSPDLVDAIPQYTKFCAGLDGVKEEEPTGAEIYDDLIAGLEGRKTR